MPQLKTLGPVGRKKMSRTKALSILAGAVGTVLTSSAHAAMVVTYAQVPLSSTALTGATTDDANLNNYDVYDLQVILTNGSQFSSGDVRAKLSTGKFYIPPANDQNVPQTLRNTAPNRYLKADNMVIAPNFKTGTTVLGASKFSPTPSAGAVFPSNGSNFFDPADPDGTATLPANDQMLVDAAWGPPLPATTIADGTYTIARLVVTKNAVGTVTSRAGTLADPGNPITFTFAIGGVTPEPTSIALMGLGLGAVALRRRK